MNNGKDTNERPTSIYYVERSRNMGSPKGGDSYGDGDLIVLSERESRLQGEGGQVRKISRIKEASEMLNAHEYLELVSERGRTGATIERVYRNIRRRDLFILAYMNLYANKGATTPGIHPEDTVDGMSMERIDHIIAKLQKGTYTWTPVKRVYIPKKNGKERPLGIPVWSDKMLQEVMRVVLEAYYEPQFRMCSHGFRPNRGCHTALNEIHRTWVGTKWFVEGDIKGCFDNISHQKMLEILGRSIEDERFLKLIKEMLEAGYMEKWNRHGTFSGTPQGGIISPLLANIFLNELDVYIGDILIPAYTKGKKRKLNPEWRTLSTAKSYFKKRGDWEEYWKRDERQRMIPSQDMYDPDYRRLRYVRYADDFLLGLAGTKAEAEQIRKEIGAFLETQLGLELSEHKTLITHAGNEKARFLNYEITVMNNDTRRTAYKNGRKRRSINGGIWLGIPKDVTEQWKAKVLKERKIEYRVEFLQLSDYDIVQRYEAEMQGLINYYAMAHDVNQKLRKVRYFYMASLARTLAYKHKTNHRSIYAKHIRYNAEGHKVIVVEVPRDGKQSLIASFGSKPIRQNRATIIKDDLKATYRFIEPNQLITRLLADVCELCGSKEHIQVHHIRKLKDLKKRYEGKQEKPEWVKRMIGIQRKTLIVCQKCHKEIHCGTFDGAKLR